MAGLKLSPYTDIRLQDVETEGAEGVSIRWLISGEDDPPNFQMRIFEVAPEGYTPLHSHDWEHEVFILKGSGKLIYQNEERPFSEGYFVLIPPGDKHSLINTGEETLKFLCMIPNP
jgi:quercetin dioxygenase-like cupin family protein